MASTPNIEYLDLSCSLCNIPLHKYNIVNSECNHQFCNNCFFHCIRNSSECIMCGFNYAILDHEKIKNDLYNSFPSYLTQWSTFIRLKNLNEKLEGINSDLKDKEKKLKTQLIHTKDAIDYNSGYYYGSLKHYKLTKKGNYYVDNYHNSHWVKGYKDANYALKKNEEKDRPNENVEYEEPHCDGCVCFEEWSISSDDSETSNNNIDKIDKNYGYMQYC